jgi:membrane protein
MLKIKKIYYCFYNAAVDTIKHDGIEHAGYIAFLAILSLFPFLVFFVALVGSFGQSEIGIKLIDIILQNNIIPAKIIPSLQPRIEEIASGPPQGLLTIAIIGAIWTSSSMVDALRTILNYAYRVHTPPAYIWRRLMSIAEFLVLTASLIIVIFLLIITPNILEHIKDFFHIKTNIFSQNLLWFKLRYAITTVILFLVVVSSYMILPNVKQTFISVSPGASVVILLWFIIGNIFSLYLSKFEQVNIIYGSLGGIIAFLLFIYLTAMIFIYGAELNYRLQRAKGDKIILKAKK